VLDGSAERYRVRAAREADAPLLARVILMATRSHLSRGLFDLLFPGSDDERLALIEALVVHPAECHCHWGGFLVAELDSEPVGALCGFEPLVKTPARLERAIVESMLRAGLGDELETARLSVEPFERCRPEIPDDVWVVEWVAVEPAHRGQGVLPPLMDAILAEGRRRGYRQAQLALMLGNDRAERAYERHGFRIVGARTHPSMERAVGSPGVARMAARL